MMKIVTEIPPGGMNERAAEITVIIIQAGLQEIIMKTHSQERT